jgi:hypothetical protein
MFAIDDEDPSEIVLVDVDDTVPVLHWVPGNAPILAVYVHDRTQFLENRITGEIVQLSQLENGSWSLRYHDGFGFLEGPGGTLEWVNNVFKETLWSVRGRMMVKTVGDDDTEEIVKWLSDLQRTRTFTYASWKSERGVKKMPRLAVLTIHAPRSGAVTFLDMKDLQRAAEFSAKFAASYEWCPKMVDSWRLFLEGVGIAPNHFLKPFAGDRVVDLRVQSWHCSVVAAMGVFVYCASHMKQNPDRSSSKAVLAGLIKHFLPSDFQVLLPRYDVMVDNLNANQAQQDLVTLEIVGLKVSSCQCLPWAIGLTLCDFMLEIMTRGTDSHHRTGFWSGVLQCIELLARDATWPSDPLSCLTPAGSVRRADRRVRHAMMELPLAEGRNPHKPSALARRLGLDVPVHKAWVDKAYCRQYITALDASLSDSLSFGLTFDKGRRTGKDWMRGVVMGFEQNSVGHLPFIVPWL